METLNIPTLFGHNHASNIIALSNGDLMCVWFGGSCEGKADISIHSSRLKSGEMEWSRPVILSNDSERSEQNPILFEYKPGVLWLLYTAQKGIHQHTSIVCWRRSKDYGQTWSAVETLFEKSGIFVRNPPIVLETGTIVLPAYYCRRSESGFLGEDFSVVKLSDDGGQTWRESIIEKSTGLVHLSLVKSENDEIIGFFRSRQADYIYRTISKDGGLSWLRPEPTSLPNNNASIQSVMLENDCIAMAYNEVNKFEVPPKINKPPWFDQDDLKAVVMDNGKKSTAVWGVRRSPLVVSISKDQGRSWEKMCTVITNEGFDSESEFSYPSITQSKDGNIHIVYTYKRQYIQHKVLLDFPSTL